MSGIKTLTDRLADYRKCERHISVAEVAYWCGQYRQLCAELIDALSASATLAANSAQVGEVVAYLREIDSGTGNACLVIGNKTDTDSFAVCKAAPPVATAAQSVASEVVRDARASDKKDAERYRWLRDNLNIDSPEAVNIFMAVGIDEWNAAIDAAIAINTKKDKP